MVPVTRISRPQVTVLGEIVATKSSAPRTAPPSVWVVRVAPRARRPEADVAVAVAVAAGSRLRLAVDVHQPDAGTEGGDRAQRVAMGR